MKSQSLHFLIKQIPFNIEGARHSARKETENRVVSASFIAMLLDEVQFDNVQGLMNTRHQLIH